MNWQDPRISKIIELELKITEAIIHGHKPRRDDEYEKDREELKRLREELKIKNHDSSTFNKA